jgi:hypothetical protein
MESWFFLRFLHDNIRIRIRIHSADWWIRIQEAQKHVDPVDPDPDPQHWLRTRGLYIVGHKNLSQTAFMHNLNLLLYKLIKHQNSVHCSANWSKSLKINLNVAVDCSCPVCSASWFWDHQIITLVDQY